MVEGTHRGRGWMFEMSPASEKPEGNTGPRVTCSYAVALELVRIHSSNYICLGMFSLFWLIRFFESCFQFRIGRERGLISELLRDQWQPAEPSCSRGPSLGDIRVAPGCHTCALTVEHFVFLRPFVSLPSRSVAPAVAGEAFLKLGECRSPGGPWGAEHCCLLNTSQVSPVGLRGR